MQGRLVMIILIAATTAMTPQPQNGGGTPSAAAPISVAPLPRWPFLRWPDEVVPQNTPVDQGFGHFRFWDGKALQDVEGRTFMVTLVRRDGHGEFNEYLMRRTVESDLARMGGVRIAAGRVPRAVIDTINDTDRQALLPGLGDIWNSPVQTWIIRRPNRQIWVQYTDTSAEASIAVVETRPD